MHAGLEKLLFAIEVDEVEKAAIEAELAKFEKWTQEVRPHVGKPNTYKPPATVN